MDGRRSLALAGACAGFVAVPILGALSGRGERTDRYDTVITPPSYAFAVWAPIFAGCVVSAVGQCLPGGRGDPMSRAAGWPLAGAYAVNTAWSVAAQSDRFALTPYLLPSAVALAATAHVRLQRVPDTSGPVAVTPAGTGLLLGWTALAAAVNVVAARPDRDAARMAGPAAAGLLAVSAAVAAGVAASRRGGVPLALGAGWGLATLGLRRDRPSVVRVAAALGASVVSAAAIARTRHPAPACA